MTPTRNVLATSLVAFATLLSRAQEATPQRQSTPMPEKTTQAPAPVVRVPTHSTVTQQSAPQQIVPNPDGSLPRSIHLGEYKNSYPVNHPPAANAGGTRQIPTTNPLTSLSSQSASKPATISQPKTTALAQPAKPKSAAPAKTPVSAPAIKTGASQVTTQIAPGPFNRNIVVIDPSHGGNDVGSRITDSITEKDVDLQLAFKLRSLLSARGLTVVLTRESDTATLPDKPDSPLTLDVRAGLANRQQAVACLLLHATGSGRGAHLYTSELNAVPAEPYAAPWLTAQNGWVSQSSQLQKNIGRALSRANVPLVFSRASVRPVDSLTCPALVLELAPEDNTASSINNDEYQQRVANAVATALIFWQNNAQPPMRLAPPVYKAPAPVVEKPVVPPSPATSSSYPAPAVQP